MAWSDLVRKHCAAADRFGSDAARVPPDAWVLPRAEGKWSAAEIVEHVSAVYRVMLRELDTGTGMRIRTRLFQRLLLRMTYMRRIVRSGEFPQGAPAPRELRPERAPEDQAAAVEALRELSQQFISKLTAARERRPKQKLTHAYFGRMTAEQAIAVGTAHLEHHRRQLPG